MVMKTTTTIIIGVVALALIGAMFYFRSPVQAPVDENNTPNSTSTNNNGTSTSNNPPIVTNDIANLIKVTNPVPNAVIKNPLTLTGQARGYWFFEASAPVKLLDANGKEIANTYIQAQGDWMTENFVPFKGTLQFATPSTPTGTLVFENDNPSGLSSNRRELRIPVKFDLTNPTMEVKAYFSTNEDAQTTCEASQAISRIVPKTVATAGTALNELLKSPTDDEKLKYGVFTSINPGVKVQKLEIKNGTAYVDFNSALEFQVGGSCRVSAIRSQITNTLKQFSTIQNVVISIDGRTEDILQP